ncbi:MAG: matrixin family metalloprotease [Polyangiaceae bacterium]|nr:matrixin family metalloprotease [Polyangiaceae bacterium]
MTPSKHVVSSAFALAVGLAVLSFSQEGWAFCRTRTCDPTDEMCERDATGCITTGAFLHWTNACTSFDVHEAGSPKRGVTFDTANSLIADALSKWVSVDCPGGKQPSLTIRNKGPVACGVPIYNSDGPNANVWMFADKEWVHVSDAHTLALTTVRYDPANGEIYDADVEINSAQSIITTGDVNIGADLESIVTHESGHFFGLSHSENSDATMWAGYSPGKTNMRALAQDDVNAICEAYPQGREVASPTCEPRRGFTKQCSEDLSSGGCSVAPRGLPAQSSSLPSSLAWPSVSLMGAALAFWARRRRA